MTSRELVKRAIHFQNPGRVPVNYDSNRFPCDVSYGDDILWGFVTQDPNFTYVDENGNRISEWGSKWETMGETMGEPVSFPLEGLEEYADRKLPDFANPARYQAIRELVKNNKDEKYIMGMLPTGIFQVMIDLFGFEDFMYQIAGNTEEFCAFLHNLTDLVIQTVHQMGKAGVDGIILIEDMGLQDRMMISPKMWHEIYAPEFTRIFTVAHSYGMDVISHTCGHIVSILDDYINCGVDVIQMDQQDNMGLETLHQFAGRLCFFCPLDIQTSVDCSREEAFARAKRMLKNLATPQGGFMAKTYPQPSALHMDETYLKNLVDAFTAASREYYGA